MPNPPPDPATAIRFTREPPTFFFGKSQIKNVLKLVGEGDYVPHGLHATAAIRLIEAGCSEDQAAAITGHRDLNLLRGYVRARN